ncbi:MAG: CblZ, a non-orthologous displasment for Alpha-ribazole-5'-phosphate phosphatase, partial [uncultured Corynebacteriales bacterium]
EVAAPPERRPGRGRGDRAGARGGRHRPPPAHRQGPADAAPPGGPEAPHRSGRPAAEDPPRGVPADAGAGRGAPGRDARRDDERRRALPDAPRPRPGAQAGPGHRGLAAQRRRAVPVHRGDLLHRPADPERAGQGGDHQPVADRAAAAGRRLDRARLPDPQAGPAAVPGHRGADALAGVLRRYPGHDDPPLAGAEARRGRRPADL